MRRLKTRTLAPASRASMMRSDLLLCHMKGLNTLASRYSDCECVQSTQRGTDRKLEHKSLNLFKLSQVVAAKKNLQLLLWLFIKKKIINAERQHNAEQPPAGKNGRGKIVFNGLQCIANEISHQIKVVLGENKHEHHFSWCNNALYTRRPLC